MNAHVPWVHRTRVEHLQPHPPSNLRTHKRSLQFARERQLMTDTESKFSCRHCGALYEVTIYRTPFRDRDTAECEVCRKTMREWNSTAVPSYKLIAIPQEEQPK